MSGMAERARMSAADFNKLARFMVSNYGIKMPQVKQTMVEGRLQKRLSALKIDSFGEYLDHVFDARKGLNTEMIQMVDLLTTNKTDFFREPDHFDFLLSQALPNLLERKTNSQPIKIWSAGCSSGEEPYTLSIVMQEFARQAGRVVPFEILATDLSVRMLEKAAQAIYPISRVVTLPLKIKKDYFLKSKDEQRPTVRPMPKVRQPVRYQRLNFMDDSYDVPRDFDIIFCRNVLIYFDLPVQEQVINKLCRHLSGHGFFFLGHSESTMQMDVPLHQIKPTVFQKKH